MTQDRSSFAPRASRLLPTRLIAIALLIGAGAALCGTLAGCNIVGPAVVLVAGPDKTEAQHKLDPNRPTVIFVDDRSNIFRRRSLRLIVAESTQQFLLERAKLMQVLDARAAMAAAAREPSAEPMDLVSLGKSVGAEIVIYVSVDKFLLSPDGSTYAPEAQYRVKVLDVTKTAPRVWPEEREGVSLVASIPTRTEKPPVTTADVIKAEETLARRSGEIIARLFYTYETRERLQDHRP